MKNKMMTKIVFFCICLFSLSGCFKSEKGQEAKWPNKAIKIVIPVGAGGDTDINGRLLAKYLEKELGQPVVVSNIAGAAGTLGTRQVKDAKPDGYTVLFFHNTTILTQMRGLLDFNVFNEFKLAGIPLKDQTGVLVADAKKYKNLTDFIAKSTSKDGGVKVAASTGSLAQLIPLAFEKETNTNFNIVDAGGTAERIAAMKGGHIDMFFAQYGVVQDYVKNGDFIVLGAVSGKRNSLMPEIPTLKEQGVNIEFDKFFYFAFPPKTSDEIVNAFSNALKNISSEKGLIKDFSNFYLSPEYNDSSDSNNYIKNTEKSYNQYKNIFVK